MTSASAWENVSALGGTRTPNLLIRSQMLYPLSYERWLEQYTVAGTLAALPVLHAFHRRHISARHREPFLDELGLRRRLGLMSQS